MKEIRILGRNTIVYIIYALAAATALPGSPASVVEEAAAAAAAASRARFAACSAMSSPAPRFGADEASTAADDLGKTRLRAAVTM
jgi:hypothetical protein